MKPSVVSNALRALVVGEKQAVFIWGSPGSGKSAVVNQLAADLGIALRDIRALLLDPVDLRGLPSWGRMADHNGPHRTFFLKPERASCFSTN